MKKSLYVLGLALLAAMACNKQENATPVTYDDGLITFTTGSPRTRATGVTEVTTASLTQFNVIATSGTTTQTQVWNDGVFTGTPGGNYTGGKYWPSSSVSWNFYASNAAMTFAASGATIAVADSNNDIVADYIEGATYKTSNALTFEHILCQLGTVTMKGPDGFTVTDLKVSLQPIYSGTYNMRTDAWTRGTASAAVYVFGTAATGVDLPAATNTATSVDNDLWLVPGQYQLTATYTISKGDWSNSYEKHATVTLLQGVNNNLSLPDLDNNGVPDPNIPDPSSDVSDIIFTVTVTPWSDQDIPANFS